MSHGDLWQRLARCEVVDLAQGLRRGIPVSPNHPPFQMSLLRRHGDVVRPDGTTGANELIVTGGHVGTHVDALAHIARDGALHGGVLADDVTSHEGFARLGIDEFIPFVGRGVLLDVARGHGADVLPAGYEVTPADLEDAERAAGVTVGPGDAALIRTGWPVHWDDHDRFLGARDGTPGPGEAAARWLSAREVALTGGETIPYEVVDPAAGHGTLPVHRHLLVEAGINIVEVLDLTGLSGRDLGAFTLILAPLKIVGATGAPVRPLALIEPS